MTRMAFRHRMSIRRGFLTTAMGLEERGYFVPYRFAGKTDRKVARYPAIEAIFASKAAAISDFLGGTVRSHADAFRAFGDSDRWRTRFLSPRDAAVAYAMVRTLRPKRVLEIGSGTTTWFMARAVADAGIDCAITCVDPQPRSAVDELPVTHLSRPLAPEDAELAAALEPGDILFIDSSHIMLPGMDVDIEFNLMFPRLKPGVVVHVHDVFLPDNYPEFWAKRMFSEQNALVGWIVSGYFDVLFPGYYATTRHRAEWQALAADFSPLDRKSAGSLWMRRGGAGPAAFGA